MATPSFLSDSQGERVDTIIDSAGSTYYKGAIGSNAAGGNGPTAAQLIGTHKPSVATAATDPFVAVLGTQWGAVGSNTYPIAVDTAGRVIVTGSAAATAIPISGTLTTTPPANASTNITQVGGAAIALGAAASASSIPVALSTDGTVIGPVTETAPATDTASSGLNGRLQRIAQRLTSIIGVLPAALGGGGGLKVEGVGTVGTPTGGVVTVQGPVTTVGAFHDGSAVGTSTPGGSVHWPYVATSGAGAPGSALTYSRDGTGNIIPTTLPIIFKSAAATAAGNTAVWTPTTGKKFRLQRLMLEITANASLAAGAILTVDLQDATTSTNMTFSLWVPTTAVTTTAGDAWQTPWIDLANGILSAAANNVLNVNLSAALVTGTCRVIVAGTEE